MMNVLRSPDGKTQPNTGVRFLGPGKVELDTSDPHRWKLHVTVRDGSSREYVILSSISGMMLFEDRPS